MSGIEDLVRRSMREQVVAPPAMHDPAGHALRKVTAAHRRRTAVTACAGVLALVLGLAGFVMLRDSRGEPSPPPLTTTSAPPPTGDPSPTTTGVGLTVVVDGRELLLPEGRRIPLGQIGDVAEAYQTRDGWLVGQYPLGDPLPALRSLWLVKPDRSAHRLVEWLDGSVVIAPDGRRFAWRAGDRLYVGHLTGDRIEVDRSTPAPARGHPLAFTGTAVVLGYTETGGGVVENWDVWLPDRGDYTPSWAKTTHVVAVYPPAPDGSLVGLVHQPGASPASKNSCLTRLDPANNLRAIGRPACGLLGTIDPWARVSPDGRWLAVFDTGRVVVLDLATVFDRPALAWSWDVDRLGVWADATTMIIVHRDGGLRRLRIGGAPEPVNAPGLPPGAQVELVPRLS